MKSRIVISNSQCESQRWRFTPSTRHIVLDHTSNIHGTHPMLPNLSYQYPQRQRTFDARIKQHSIHSPPLHQLRTSLTLYKTYRSLHLQLQGTKTPLFSKVSLQNLPHPLCKNCEPPHSIHITCSVCFLLPARCLCSRTRSAPSFPGCAQPTKFTPATNTTSASVSTSRALATSRRTTRSRPPSKFLSTSSPR